jgi:Fic family protein
MKKSDFLLGGVTVFSDRAGSYSLSYSDDYLKSYYTFTPHPLCNDLAITVDSELLSLLVNAHRQLGLLEGFCRNVRNIGYINRLLLVKEAAASYSIDDKLHFTYPELFGIVRDKKRENRIVPVMNHIIALEYGIEELNRARLNNKHLYATHGILMAHSDNEIVGAVRKKQTILGDIMVRVADMKTYNPTKPEEIKSCMKDIQEYIKRDDSTNLLIKAALLHYQLEAVHPFESGNGKIGRILIAQYLYETGLLKSTLLPISEFLLIDKVEYFDRINAVHYWGRFEQWIKYFLKIVGVAAETTLSHIEAVIKLREQYVAQINDVDKDVKYLFIAYDRAEKNIFINTASLSEEIDVSYNTGARVMDTLVRMGVMKLLKSQARNRIYYYAGFLEAMGISVNTTLP